MQFATELLRHCVTRSHRSKETGATEPKTLYRIVSHHQVTRFRTIPPANHAIRDKVAASLRHTVTSFRRQLDLILARLGTERPRQPWHEMALSGTEYKSRVGIERRFVLHNPSTLSSANSFCVFDRISVYKTSYVFLATRREPGSFVHSRRSGHARTGGLSARSLSLGVARIPGCQVARVASVAVDVFEDWASVLRHPRTLLLS
jgi:hypothetical protein